VAPTQPVPIVRLMEGRRQFALVRWGLIPAWAKDPRTFSLLINARAESINDKPAFKYAMKRRRCLFLADGFYEWNAGERGRPYFARPTGGGPIAFAGVWETWMGANGEEMETAAIVTTTASNTLRPLHDRMPVVVQPDAFDFWLDCANVDAQAASALLVPAPENFFEAYPISPAVNRVANDDPSLLAPAGAEPAEQPATPAKRARKPKTDERQSSLF
jgi:putative SOS response-associated peptidase YedK